MRVRACLLGIELIGRSLERPGTLTRGYFRSFRSIRSVRVSTVATERARSSLVDSLHVQQTGPPWLSVRSRSQGSEILSGKILLKHELFV